MYIYKSTGRGIFAVGFYDPDGKFVTETVYPEYEAAAERVHYLNGGINPEVFGCVVEDLRAMTMNLFVMVEDLNVRLDRISKPI